jgi:HEAT repeat protein
MRKINKTEKLMELIHIDPSELERKIEEGEKDIPFLVSAIGKDKSAYIHALAVSALCRIDDGNVPELIESLESKDSYVREHICYALGRIYVFNPKKNGCNTIEASAPGKNEYNAIEALVTRLSDKSKFVRRAAVYSLSITKSIVKREYPDTGMILDKLYKIRDGDKKTLVRAEAIYSLARLKEIDLNSFNIEEYFKEYPTK